MDIYATSLLRAMLVLAALQCTFFLLTAVVRAVRPQPRVVTAGEQAGIPATLASAFHAVAVAIILSARAELFYLVPAWGCVAVLGLRGLTGVWLPGGRLCALLSAMALLLLAAMLVLLMRSLF